MNSNISQILRKLEKEIESPTVKDSFDRGHIFTDIKAILRDKCSVEEMMDLTYMFTVYEKSLSYDRRGSLHLAAHWIEQGETMYKDMSASIQGTLDILYHPMKAYHLYVTDDAQGALEHLGAINAICADVLKDEPVLRLEMLMEQAINNYRVYYTISDEENCLKWAHAILELSVNGVNTKGVLEGDYDLVRENIENAKTWTRYISNALIAKVIFDKKNKDKDATLHSIFSVLFDVEDWSTCTTNGYRYAIEALKAEQDNDVQKQIEALCKMTENVHEIPSFLQVYVFQKSLQAVEELAPEMLDQLEATLLDYYSKNLEINKEDIQKTISSISKPVAVLNV